MTALTTTGRQSFSLVPTNLQEAMQYADMIANSNLVPNAYKGKPGDVMIAMQMGMEVGLNPLAAIQNIAVINGKPAMYGDALIGIVRNSPVCEAISEHYDEATQTAVCRVKRRGEDWQERTFSRQDAELAKLWGKSGPWQQYPKRMLQMRARGWALRDVFPDALQGIAVAEEVRDMAPEKEINPAPQQQAKPASKAQAVLQRVRQAQQSEPEAAPWGDAQQDQYDDLLNRLPLAESQQQLSELANELKHLGNIPPELHQQALAAYKARKAELDAVTAE